MMRASILLVFVAACSTLSDVDEKICGNGVLEPGEDCDSSDESCKACGLVCDHEMGPDADAQCAAYKGAAGYVCGADDFCHAPAGKFRTPTELSTSVETFGATDV